MIFYKFSFDLIFTVYGFYTRISEDTSIVAKISLHLLKLIIVLVSLAYITDAVHHLTMINSFKEGLGLIGILIKGKNFIDLQRILL